MMVKERKLFIALRVFHFPGGFFFCACELPGDKVLFYGNPVQHLSRQVIQILRPFEYTPIFFRAEKSEQNPDAVPE